MNWDRLWINANIATMTGDSYGIIEAGAVAVKDGKIAWVGPMNELGGQPICESVEDCRSNWLTPGLVDCHTHLLFAGDRRKEFTARLQGQSYQEIGKAGGGIYSTVAATRACSEIELMTLGKKRLQHWLNHGVTTIEIKSGYGLDYATEEKLLRIGKSLSRKMPLNIVTTYLGAHMVPAEENAEAYIDLICEEILPKLASLDLIDAVDGFCDSMAFSEQHLRKLFNKARQLNLAIKLHAEQLSPGTGAALAAEFSALSADHLEYCSYHALQSLHDAGVVPVLLPGAYYYLQQQQKPPVAAMQQLRMPIALGSDFNPGSSPVCSLLIIMNMGCVLFGLTPEQALLGVTVNGAKALGLANEVGTLEEIGRASCRERV